MLKSSIPRHDQRCMYTQFVHENISAMNDILRNEIILYSIFHKLIIFFSCRPWNNFEKVSSSMKEND